MGKRQHTRRDDRRHAQVNAHSAGRGRMLPFPLRRAAPRPRSRQRPAGSVGTDLRAGQELPQARAQRTTPGVHKAPSAPSLPPGRREPSDIFRPAATTPAGATGSSPADASSRKRKIPRRLALLTLVCAQVLFAVVALWAATSPYWQVRHVRVEGTDDATVVRAIEALPLTGCNIFRCDLAGRVHRVEALPAVARAGIRAVYPDMLVVSVTLRRPALLWNTPAGQLVIASDGTVLGTADSDPAYADAALAQVRDATGAAFGGQTPAAGSQLSPTLVEMAGQLRKGVQEVLGNDWTLAYTADIGFVAASADGRQVDFGTPRDAAQAADDSGAVASLLSDPTSQEVAQGVQTQLAELRALLHQLGGAAGQAVLIDLRWGGHPFYRLAG